MHNLISHNQLAGWKQSVQKLTQTLERTIDEADVINDYYNCLIECDDDQSVCKRICRSMLSKQTPEKLSLRALGESRGFSIIWV